MRRTLIALSLVAAASAAMAAGQVDVSFKPIDQLSDVGRGSFDGERNVKALTDHFKSLAARLPDGQTLKIEVQDVNMAGEMKPMRGGSDIRVMKGNADWPTIDLRWSLQADGRTLKSADERLADLSYLMHPVRGLGEGPVAYEARMIDRWFKERIVAQAAPR
jgi:hypothetical protein